MHVDPVEPIGSSQRPASRPPQVWRLDKKRQLYVQTRRRFPDLQPGETLVAGEVRRTADGEWVAIGG